MEEIIKSTGLAGLLSAVTVMSALHLMAKLAEFFWQFRENKDKVTATVIENLSDAVKSNTIATEKLDGRLKEVEQRLANGPKFKLELKRTHAALKMLAGEKWEGIKKRVLDDEDGPPL
jgi:hypothetical protein